jgi:hypothetical protein
MKTLPLTPLEAYLYEDDVPAHPCWQVVRLEWEGSLRREALERAWAEATRRQPLLGARVTRGPLGGLRWDLSERVEPPLHWIPGSGRQWPEWQPIDLARGPGARLYVLEEAGHAHTILCAHHAVCDGLSLLDVLEDTFSAYTRELGEPCAARPAPLGGSLRQRGQYGSGWIGRFTIPLMQLAGFAIEAKLLRRTVAPLVPHEPAPDDGPRPAEWPATVRRTWDPKATAAVRDAAKHAASGLPELLMRDLQAAIGSWRTSVGAGVPEDWIRLGTAIGLRRKIRGSWPAANLFGIAIIDRQQRSLANRARLLRRAREDTALIERWSLAYGFWTLLSLRRFAPGGIRAYARRRVVRMSFVMSFIGKVFSRTSLRREGRFVAVPGAVMKDVWGFAPTRPGTCATMDLAIIFSQLVACLHYDPRVVSPGQAAAFMDAFAAELSKSVAGEPPA